MDPHFFQLLDRIRYEAAVAALSRHGKSLAIVSPVQALAEHYKEMLMARLAVDVPDARIKAFFPADTDAIVSSFNKVVADLPLAQAMAAPTADRPLQLWVVHDAAALPSGEVLMMLDLLDKFPGAHVRALLVFAGTDVAPDGLEGFEKSLMRWVIDRPSLEQIKDSLSRVDDPMQAADVRDLVSRMAPGSPAKSTRAAAALTVPGSATHASEPSAQKPTDAKKPEAQGKKQPDKSNAPNSTASSKTTRLKVAAVIAGLLLFSAGVAAWLNPEALQALTGPAATQEPAKTAEPAPVVVPTNAANTETPNNEAPPPADAQTSAEAKPAQDVTPSTAPTITPAPQPEKVYALMTPEERQQTKLEAQPKKKSESMTSKAVEPEVELPAGAVEGQAWVKGFARGTFVVQHTNSETYAKARDRQKRFPNLSEAKVVPQFEADQGRAKFALISGPFESKELADTFLKTENMPKESWVRSSRAIQKRLTPPAEGITTKP